MINWLSNILLRLRAWLARLALPKNLLISSDTGKDVISLQYLNAFKLPSRLNIFVLNHIIFLESLLTRSNIELHIFLNAQITILGTVLIWLELTVVGAIAFPLPANSGLSGHIRLIKYLWLFKH